MRVIFLIALFFKYQVYYLNASGEQLINSNTCKSPNGSDCSWYRDCLAKQFDCSQSNEDYAILYGEKFCNLFENNFEAFSTRAQNWVNSVKMCLQLELSSFINKNNDASCTEIQRAAFNSHTECYMRSGVCELTFHDWFVIFNTMKSALIPFSGSAYNSFKGVVEVGANCIIHHINNFMTSSFNFM